MQRQGAHISSPQHLTARQSASSESNPLQGSRVLCAPASHRRFGDSWHACDVPVVTAAAQVLAELWMSLPLGLYRKYFHAGILPPEMARGMSGCHRKIKAGKEEIVEIALALQNCVRTEALTRGNTAVKALP